MRQRAIRRLIAGAAGGLCLALSLGGGAVAAARVSSSPGNRAAAAATAGWGKAIEVPGLAALMAAGPDPSGGAAVRSVSCAGPGSCAAGGAYDSGPGTSLAFVVNETRGRWGKAIEVPGLSSLDASHSAGVNAVSCAAPGNCSAAGVYSANGGGFPFVVSEVGGKWGNAIKVRGTASPGYASAVSCAGVGDCTAVGYYGGNFFGVNQTRGKWGKAVFLGKPAAVASVSCAAPGDCTAGGHNSNGSAPFAVTQTRGKWGRPARIVGPRGFGSGSPISSVSCAAPGDCSAGGYYSAGNHLGATQAFVVNETSGRWGKAIEVPGTGALNKGGDAMVESVSCAARGSCAAGGEYANRSGRLQTEAFVVNQSRGHWGRAIEVPGIAALGPDGANLASVSCAAPGTCSGGGYYVASQSLNNSPAFVVDESRGRWGKAIELPGLAALTTSGNAIVLSVSCKGAGSCAAGGDYLKGLQDLAFVVNRQS